MQPGDQLVLIVTTNTNTTIATPAGWSSLGTRQDGTPDMTSTVFTRTADGTTAGSTVAAALGTSSKASAHWSPTPARPRDHSHLVGR